MPYFKRVQCSYPPSARDSNHKRIQRATRRSTLVIDPWTKGNQDTCVQSHAEYLEVPLLDTEIARDLDSPGSPEIAAHSETSGKRFDDQS